MALLAIIEKLYHSILAGSENRIEERTHFEDREVDVAIGVDLVMRKLREGAALPGCSAAAERAPSAPPRTRSSSRPPGLSLVERCARRAPRAAPTDDPDLERLRVLDLSSKGYGLLVDRAHERVDPAERPPRAAQPRERRAGSWASVVRKLPNRVRGEMLLGVEVLAYRPVPVELARATAAPRRGASTCRAPTPTASRTRSLVRVGGLLLRHAVHARGRRRATYRVRLNRIIRKGADWIKVRFEIVSRA